MKNTTQILSTALAAAALFSSQALHAESTYGYNTTGAAASASARVDMSITIPKLIMLRVGPAGTDVGVVSFGTTITPPASSGLTTFAEGNDQAINWDGTAPTLTASNAPVALSAYAWTNVPTATLTGAAENVVAGSTGLTGASILVSNNAGDTLAHPGANAETFTPVALLPNTPLTGTWTYSLDTLPASSFGTFSQTVRYTASAL